MEPIKTTSINLEELMQSKEPGKIAEKFTKQEFQEIFKLISERKNKEKEIICIRYSKLDLLRKNFPKAELAKSSKKDIDNRKKTLKKLDEAQIICEIAHSCSLKKSARK